MWVLIVVWIDRAGVKSVDVDLKQQKATVTGFVDPKKVLKKAQSTGKKAEPWPYVPYNLIAHPYAAQVYDKKAPPGYVRATEDTAVATLSTVEEQYTTMFSDENPNACFIMQIYIYTHTHTPYIQFCTIIYLHLVGDYAWVDQVFV